MGPLIDLALSRYKGAWSSPLVHILQGGQLQVVSLLCCTLQEEELAGKTREVEQLTSLLSSSKQQVESLERDLGAKEGALRLANLKLKEAESIQNGVRSLTCPL